MKLTTDPHLTLKSKKDHSHTSAPFWAFKACSRLNFFLLVVSKHVLYGSSFKIYLYYRGMRWTMNVLDILCCLYQTLTLPSKSKQEALIFLSHHLFKKFQKVSYILVNPSINHKQAFQCLALFSSCWTSVHVRTCVCGCMLVCVCVVPCNIFTPWFQCVIETCPGNSIQRFQAERLKG